MTTIKQHQKTPAERSFDQLVDEVRESPSEAARTVLEQALGAAYKGCMVHTYCYQPQEEDDDMEAMHLAAADLTDHDCEQLMRIWRAALAAAASVNPYDNETIVGWCTYPANLHQYYRMLSRIVEEVEWEKRYTEVRKKELAAQEPIDRGRLVLIQTPRDQKAELDSKVD